jgi:hypothetical protein
MAQLARRRANAPADEEGSDVLTDAVNERLADDAESHANGLSRGRSNGHSGDPQERLTASVGSGWGTLKDQRAKRSGSAHRLQVKDDEMLVHFLDDEPFAVYQQHWVGQRSYACPGDKCPLCDAGYDTRTLALFNVVDVKSGGNMFWEAGPNAAKAVIDASEKPISSPINKEDLYFAIQRNKQSNGFFAFTLTPIKKRDLLEDYGQDPLTTEELADAAKGGFDDTVVPYNSPRDLRAVADGADDE